MRYLCENRGRVCLDPSELLLYSIMSDDKKITAALKEMGVTFSAKLISALTEDRRKSGWIEYHIIQLWLDDNDFFDVLQSIVREIGEKKMLFDDRILGYNRSKLHSRWYYSDPEKFGFILEHFDQKHMNKMMVMKCAILEGSAACLKICTEHGWLTKPGDRDELIEYAAKQNKTECTAFFCWITKNAISTSPPSAKRLRKKLGAC